MNVYNQSLTAGTAVLSVTFVSIFFLFSAFSLFFLVSSDIDFVLWTSPGVSLFLLDGAFVVFSPDLAVTFALYYKHSSFLSLTKTTFPT